MLAVSSSISTLQNQIDTVLVDCYCTSCDEYSGGGLCRVCQRAVDYGLPASADQPLQPERPPVEPDVSTDDVAPTSRLF